MRLCITASELWTFLVLASLGMLSLLISGPSQHKLLIPSRDESPDAQLVPTPVHFGKALFRAFPSKRVQVFSSSSRKPVQDINVGVTASGLF